MDLTPHNQALNTQATALQNHIQFSMHNNAYSRPTATALHHEVTALKHDIAANKNNAVLTERMKRINTMIHNDQRMQYQSPRPNVQAGQYGGHFDHSQNSIHPTGPAFSHTESQRMQMGLRQMSATLNARPKF